MHYFKHTLFGLSLLLLASCAGKEKEDSHNDQDIIPVKLLPLNRSSSGNMITASGRFTTDDEVFLSFKTGGVINRILVKEGDAIHAGQLLATLNLTEINAQVGQVKAAYEKAQRDDQRVANLYKDSVASLEQLQNAHTALELARQQLTAAQFNRNYSEIRAAQDGYVLRKLANEGQVITSGTSVLQTNGAHNGNWLLRIGVSDKDWAAIKLNDKATITSEAVAGKTFNGKVFRRAEGVDPNTGSFGIDIKLDNDADVRLASGMYGNATISIAEAVAKDNDTGGWTIPYDALLDGDGSSGYVFVSNDGKTAEKVKVTITGMDKEGIRISEGLQNAGSLIISGSAYLTDKSRIKVLP